MIRFTCPNCDTKLKAGDDKAGTKITCPECREKVVVPAEDGDEEAAPRKKGGGKSSGSNKAALIGVAGAACVVVAGVATFLLIQGKDKGDTKDAKTDRGSQTATPDTTPITPPITPAVGAPPGGGPNQVATTPPNIITIPPALTQPGTGKSTAKAPDKTPERKSDETLVMAGPLEQDVRERLLKSATWIVTQLPKGQLAFGTGSLIDRENRLVLTNFHVISAEAKGKLRVFFPEYDRKGQVIMERDQYIKRLSKGEGIPCRVVHKDLKRDLAIVQLVDLPPGVQTLPLAKESPRPGERMHSMGNPGASGALWVYTHGNVRAVYQRHWIIPGHDKDDPTLDLDAKVVETSSPVNQGDSGGPAVNDRKELIGVTQSKLIGLGISEINYAIDVTEVKHVLRETYRNNPAMKPPKGQETPTEEGKDIPVLVKRLKASDPEQRLQAAEVLGRYGSDARPAIPELFNRLKEDKDDAVRKAAAEALQQIGSITLSYLPNLREALKDKVPEVRVAIIGILSLMGTDAEEAVPDLMTAMKDSVKVVRQKATIALGQLGPVAKAAVPELAKALKDESPDVRVAAAIGLARMQQKAAPALKEIGAGLQDDNQDVRVNLLEAVKNLGPEAKELVPELRKALKIRDEQTRIGAIQALGSIGDDAKPAIPDLVEMIEFKPLRDALSEALVRLGKSAVPKLIEKLGHPRKEVRLAAVQILEKFGSDARQAERPLLVLRAREADPDFRKAIDAALRKIRVPIQ